MTPLALLLWAAALPAAAVSVPEHEDPGAVFERSRKEPGRLHALIVSATWCEPCKRLRASLASYDSSTSPVSTADWAFTEVDRLEDGRLSALLASQNATPPDGYPSVMAIRSGKALGYSTSGANLEAVERFLKDALAAPDRAEARRPLLTCPGAPEWASYTLGVSGVSGERHTDWFGREILLAYRASPAGAPADLLAPPRLSSASLSAGPSGGGVFYAPDPTMPFDGLYRPLSGSTQAVADLSAAPGGRVRVILTGHGNPEGVGVGRAPNPRITGWNSPVTVEEPALSAAIESARRAGKEVRGLVTACYGGHFAPAFMPLPGAAPACAAFATLPDKTAEGCYASAAATRQDYANTLSGALSCPAAAGGSRERHYRAVAASAGRDVPMLSSEYFLLYGPGAEFLGRAPRQPAPPGGVIMHRFDGGVEVLLDAVGGGVLATRVNGRPGPKPYLSVLGCRPMSSLFAPPNYFTLRRRATGPKGEKAADCAPEVALEWDEEEGEGFSRRVVSLYPDNTVSDRAVIFDPVSVFDWTREQSRSVEAAAGGTVTVDARGLRPEARAWLAAVWPRFSRPLRGDGLMEELAALAEEARARDQALASALMELARRTRAAERARREPFIIRASPFSELRGALLASGAEKQESRYDYNADPDGDFSTAKLTRAMLDNLTPAEIEAEAVPMARLAHLASVAAAELALRREAADSKKARGLLAQLDALKLCERGVLD
ncbi:MAG: hypothetical protein SF051_16060 [Elusimicrobiota bacterium]|nr:hypothetical protein [Elusimicrobiota bacterium]